MKKYQIVCKKCGTVIDNFKEWFAINQKCPKCGSNHAEIEYTSDYSKLKDLYHDTPDSFWEYFDFLPLENRENIISYKEGAIPIEEWDFLEDYASRKYGINCKVYIYRNDLNGGTNTFKDVAASMAASVFKENGISKYCLASTGNTATAYSKYLTKAGIEFTVFVPNCVNQDTVEEIKSHHQHIVVSWRQNFTRTTVYSFPAAT